MTSHRGSSRGCVAFSKLAGTVVAAGAVLLVAPAAVALADTNDPVNEIGRNLTAASNQLGRIGQGNVDNLGGIGQGNVDNLGGIGQGNVDGLGRIAYGNAENLGLILQGLLGSFQTNGGSSP